MMLSEIVTEQPVPDIDIRGITDDSRKVAKGDLFLAVRGETFDGRDYLQDVIRRGAAAAVCEAPAPALTEIPVIPVERLAMHSGILASRFYGNPSERMTIVAVTGTNGKTSFTHLLADALGSRDVNCGLIGTMGHGRPGSLKEPGLTTPPAVDLQRRLKELADQGCEVTVFEASSHGIVQHRLSGCHIDIAVLTNITHDHLDYHKTMEAYRAAKEQLFHLPALRSAVVNRDDDFAEELISRLPRSVECIDYSVSGNASVSLTSVNMYEHGMNISISCRGETVEADLPLFGSFNVQNVLAVAATLVAMGWHGQEIEHALNALRPVAGRMEVLSRAGTPTLIVDYAHTPDALEKILIAVREHFPSGNLTCVFGCGGDRDSAKRPLMGEIASRLADRVIITSDNPRTEDPDQIIEDIVSGVSGEYVVEPDRATAIESALKKAGSPDIVVIAGKGHENYQETASGRIPYSDFDVIESVLADTDSRTNAIVGLGTTGLSYARYLLRMGQTFDVFDDDPSEQALIQLADETGARVQVKPISELNAADLSGVYLSPGVPLSSEHIQIARDAGVAVHGDVAMFGALAEAPIVAITGTNGKTTVAHLVHAILADQRGKAVLAGNVGTPVLDVLDDDVECYVLEASSYQLELIDQFPSEVSVVLNLSPDHMDRYPDTDTYYGTKLALYDNCRFAVLNRDLGVRLSSEVEKVATFGADQLAGSGHFGLVKQGDQYLLVNGDEELLSSSELQLTGSHNLQNVLAALAVGWLLELDMGKMLATVKGFSGLPHRGEVVGKFDGVTFINDSKATNPGAMSSAVKGCVGRVHLIAGGDTKGLDFIGGIRGIASFIDSVALVGESRSELARSLENMNVRPCDSMEEAVLYAAGQASEGDVVLLSPGCASFDQFRNYMARGEAFRTAVERLSS